MGAREGTHPSPWEGESRVRVDGSSSLVHRHPGLVLGALVVRARANQPIVVVLLEQIGRPPHDARGGDHRREEIHRNDDRIEERGRVEVTLGMSFLVAFTLACSLTARSYH